MTISKIVSKLGLSPVKVLKRDNASPDVRALAIVRVMILPAITNQNNQSKSIKMAFLSDDVHQADTPLLLIEYFKPDSNKQKVLAAFDGENIWPVNWAYPRERWAPGKNISIYPEYPTLKIPGYGNGAGFWFYLCKNKRKGIYADQMESIKAAVGRVFETGVLNLEK